jgi:hypothetical protein
MGSLRDLKGRPVIKTKPVKKKSTLSKLYSYSLSDRDSRPCPYCGSPSYAEFVDIGVGMEQCSPYLCENCGASQIGTYDDSNLSSEEERTGWYKGWV